MEQVYAGANRGVLADVDLLQRITEACRTCVREFVRDRTGIDGRIGEKKCRPSPPFGRRRG